MDIELQKSYLELLDRIKAEARDNNTAVITEIITHFQPYFPTEKKNPIKRVLNNIFLNHNKTTPINSIDHLLHRLEAKNIISKSNILPLSFIIDKLANTRLKSYYERHEALILQVANKTQTVLPAKQNGLNKEVRETVCHGISRRWKNLGRELGMTEEQIEQIEHKHKHEDFAICASKVLDCFESKTEPSELETLLDLALIAAKRKDLADKIKPLMAEAAVEKK